MPFSYPVPYTPAAEVRYSPPAEGSNGDALTRETPVGAINGSNAAFTFTAPPLLIFRNGVNETRLGSIAGNVFTFDIAPNIGDEIEGCYL